MYRAIDQLGRVIDVFVFPRRDGAAARRFFQRAIGTTTSTPSGVVTDLAPTYPMVLEDPLLVGDVRRFFRTVRDPA